MYSIAKTHEDISHPHAVKILNNFQGFTRKTLQQMVDKKWVTLDGAMWSMTSLGYEEAENLYSQT
jgi:manganese/zinc/iron transport system permease protein